MIAITPSRRRGLLLLLVGFLIFLGCFAFPLGNLTAPEGSLAFWSVLPPVLGYLGAGVLARMFLGPRCLGKVLGLTLAATAAGFLCRLALEYGEVTIAYAFSLPNCAGLTLLGSCAARRLDDW